jgi:hypothetical protein
LSCRFPWWVVRIRVGDRYVPVTLGGGALAQSAAPLSLRADARAGAATEDANAIRGGIIIPTLIVLAIVAAVYVVTKDSDPESP